MTQVCSDPTLSEADLDQYREKGTRDMFCRCFKAFSKRMLEAAEAEVIPTWFLCATWSVLQKYDQHLERVLGQHDGNQPHPNIKLVLPPEKS